MSIEAESSTTVTGGYQQVIPVERDKLNGLGISEARCKLFASSQNTVHLNIIEFFHALPHFPIAFLQQQDGSFTPCAVLGLNIGQNLFTDKDGSWEEAVYCPAFIRRYPFITQAVSLSELNFPADAQLHKPVFVDKSALDADSPALFIANEKATPHWQAAESFVSEYISAEQQTLQFTRKLVELKLLQPFDAQIHPDKADMVRLKGLFRINENLLNKLPAKIVKDLMLSGELSRIYAHLISLENFAKLLDRSARLKK